MSLPSSWLLMVPVALFYLEEGNDEVLGSSLGKTSAVGTKICPGFPQVLRYRSRHCDWLRAVRQGSGFASR
jgi:hypothetical protein